VAKLREIISVITSKAKVWFRKIDLTKLDDLEVKEKYQVEVSNRFSALEELNESFDINKAWSNIREMSRPQPKLN